MRTQKVIFYKNWENKWTRDKERATQKRLVLVKKYMALNGQATIQII